MLLEQVEKNYDTNEFNDESFGPIPANRPTFAQLTRGVRTSLYSLFNGNFPENFKKLWNSALRNYFGTMVSDIKLYFEPGLDRGEIEAGTLEYCL